MGFLDIFFGNNIKNIKNVYASGAVILDVRSKAEVLNGAITEAKHIPLPELQHHISALKALNLPIITCCASGVRSAKAANLLSTNAINTINGGGWEKLKKTLQL